MTFDLPFPVPLHACFIKSKGGSGLPSARYKAYRRSAAEMMDAQGVRVVEGPVVVSFTLSAPDRRKRDGDNLLKCLFDNLKGRAIEDDNNQIVRRFSVEWVRLGAPCRVTVEPFAW